jgi:hypothetical protein
MATQATGGARHSASHDAGPRAPIPDRMETSR